MPRPTHPYLSTVEGWLYLAVVMDLASRRIVGWSMSDRLHAELVCQALQTAYWRRKPAPGLIMHSDRGSQYASDRYRRLIRDFRMLQSMSRKANCWDTHYNTGRPHSALGPGVPDPPQPAAALPKSKSRHRLAAGAFVRVKSVLRGLHHEYSLATA